MVTTPSAGIYIVESNSAENWISDHSGNPELLDLDLLTEGVTYCRFEFVIDFDDDPTTGFYEEVFPGGSGFSIPLEERFTSVKFSAIVPNNDHTTVKNIKKFWTYHTNFTDEKVYLFIRHSTDTFHPFYDSAVKSRAELKYLPGNFQKPGTKYEAERRTYTIKSIFRGVL